ncbi:MAG: fibrobacter succinogenes major paralogous domain-containing protein [Fibrobacter sp.]|nr:fibrobacter succinogenes major paralogous domain-containing protein [Fibrobacter sp.]
MVDPRDKQLYRVVTIGEQTWMAENLNYKTENSWCGGGSVENEGDCSKYGRLYTWAAAVGKSEDECGYGKTCGLSGKVRGVCPEGWHLPDTTEWSKLFTAVGGKSTAGKKLKSQTGWKDYNGTSGNGTDAYGFSAFPAGNRYDNGYFYDEGIYATFWSATEDNSSYAYNMYLYYSSEDAYLVSDNKNIAFSVRCLKD